ncbi:hypothetical protein BDZ97DRAFT_1775459 [Flammula alnicola]|nr:hypothetical protein BDZ97DRAFT_1880908 [Flammula alnicola]KAF8961795.1 hypothetical protein BDZ97DRAFT_1827226 [Flammula alnicola]KAF8973486.1 hypothetical protein BDZ97DRAFT_1775459 [Flammula alnicola]
MRLYFLPVALGHCGVLLRAAAPGDETGAASLAPLRGCEVLGGNAGPVPWPQAVLGTAGCRSGGIKVVVILYDVVGVIGCGRM